MLETILQHRTIRKYKQDAVPDEILNKIIEAGTRASTTGNMQVYSIIATKNKELKEKLWDCHFRQDMVKQAPLVLTFCADFNRFNHWCNLRNASPGYDNFLSFFTAAIDALLVAQNVALAGEEFGLGICYLGTTTYMPEKIIEVLNLPKFVVPVTTLVVGYPAEIPELTDRLPVKAVYHEETYHEYTDNDINNLYHEKENLHQMIELVKINQTENLAQIFTQKRYTKKDNEIFSAKLLKILETQGFFKS